LKILFVNAHGDSSVGGAEKHVAELAAELSRRGHTAHLLQAFPDAGPPGFAGERTVLHRTHWRTSELRRVQNHVEDLVVPLRHRVREVVAEEMPDVVHTHNLPGVGTGVWEICRRLEVPVVHTLHDYWLLCPRVTLTGRQGRACRPGPFCSVRSRRLVRYGAAVDHVIGVSHYVLDRQAHAFPNARHHVIRNAVTVDLVASKPPGEKLRTIGFIGSLEYVKGVHVLLEAVPEFERRGLTLVLAGAGRLESKLRTAAARGSVRLLGHVAGAEKVAFFEQCDIGVVPSTWDEPGPYTPIEWLTSGRPVLVSPKGGMAEMLEAWTGAIAVDPTPEAIVSAVDGLREPAAWQAAVSRVREPASNGSFAEWADAHEAVYEAALASRRVAPRGAGRHALRAGTTTDEGEGCGIL
jgi:glycosyltransferase involved in cell wall biosynthesis